MAFHSLAADFMAWALEAAACAYTDILKGRNAAFSGRTECWSRAMFPSQVGPLESKTPGLHGL